MAIRSAADQAVEEVVRTSYGRLVALLAVRTNDLAAAEDALSDALVAAVRTWPERGVPDSPEAWMLTAARRALIGAHRRRETALRASTSLTLLAQELAEKPPSAFPDRRLELMFACTHPALAAEVRAPLMLQAVLGLDAARIARAFLVKPATLGQQLVRAKRRIAVTAIPYRVPEPAELPGRLGFVLDAIYAAYGTGWDDRSESDNDSAGLAAESVHLSRAVVDLLPEEAEAHGLLSLILHSDARSGARRDSSGRFVPLADQAVTLWSRDSIEVAERHLSTALSLGAIGPYQLQAAIQSVHNLRAVRGTTDWVAIIALYDGLHQIAPSLGATVARAAAHLQAYGPVEATAALADVSAEEAMNYQPYWVTQAEIARASANTQEAQRAMTRAIDLTTDPEVAEHLRRRM